MKLTNIEEYRIKSLLASEPPNSKRAIRLSIITNLAKGKKRKEIANECGTSPKTVWKTEHRFLVFGLDGILDDAPRSGCNRVITSDTEKEILQYPFLNDPTDSVVWTGTELACKLGIKKSTLYNYLNKRSIRLNNPTTLREASIKDRYDPSEVVGLFISPSVSLMMFTCNDRLPSSSMGITGCTMNPQERNLLSFYRKTCYSVTNLLSDVISLASCRSGRGLEPTDVSIFLRLSERGMDNGRRIILITGNKSSMVWKKVDMYCIKNPLVYLEDRKEEWLESVYNEVYRPEMMNKPNALRMENLESDLRKWLEGKRRKTGIFCWLNPMKS